MRVEGSGFNLRSRGCKAQSTSVALNLQPSTFAASCRLAQQVPPSYSDGTLLRTQSARCMVRGNLQNRDARAEGEFRRIAFVGKSGRFGGRPVEHDGGDGQSARGRGF